MCNSFTVMFLIHTVLSNKGFSLEEDWRGYDVSMSGWAYQFLSPRKDKRLHAIMQEFILSYS